MAEQDVVVAGIDASLRGTGVVALRGDAWIDDLSACRWARFGRPLEERASAKARAERLREIRRDVVTFLRQHDVTHAWIENYAFGKEFKAHEVGELGGVIRDALLEEARLGYCCQHFDEVPVASVRSFFLGKSGKGSKDAVARVFKKIDAPFGWRSKEDQDIGDAFVAANWGRSELGLPAMANVLSLRGTR